MVRRNSHYSPQFTNIYTAVATPEPQTPGYSQMNPEFAPIVVHIAYSLRNPVDGFEFVIPNDSYPFVRVLPAKCGIVSPSI